MEIKVINPKFGLKGAGSVCEEPQFNIKGDYRIGVVSYIRRVLPTGGEKYKIFIRMVIGYFYF